MEFTNQQQTLCNYAQLYIFLHTFYSFKKTTVNEHFEKNVKLMLIELKEIFQNNKDELNEIVNQINDEVPPICFSDDCRELALNDIRSNIKKTFNYLNRQCEF